MNFPVASVSAAARSRPRHLLFRVGRTSFRVARRTAIITASLIAASTAVFLLSMALGDYQLTPAQVLDSLAGTSQDPLASYFVLELRLPRASAAIAVGMALGISGAIFQSISGNPLGSPDVIGFTTGSATGALISIILLGADPLGISLGAIVGGLATAAAVYALAWRRGLSGIRLVLVGIGIAAILSAINSLLIVRASLEAAQTAGQWLAGSLNAVTTTEAGVAWTAVIILGAAAVLLARPLDLMTLGDSIAKNGGVALERTRLLIVIIGVGLVGVATATAGPVAFVALAAPQLASRLTGGPIGIIPAAWMGAVLVAASDLVAQRLFAPTQLPVGIVTGALGGAYLIWLLGRQWRKK